MVLLQQQPAPAAAYEWYAVFKLEHGTEYKINLGQTASGGTAYADPAMKLYFAEVGATLDAAATHASWGVSDLQLFLR